MSGKPLGDFLWPFPVVLLERLIFLTGCLKNIGFLTAWAIWGQGLAYYQTGPLPKKKGAGRFVIYI